MKLLVACNSQDVLAHNMCASPDVITGSLPIVVERDASSASSVYSMHVRSMAGHGIVIFAHQDVYLPAGWCALVQKQIERLPADWAVAGVCGVDALGRIHGHLWSSGLGRVIGGPFKPVGCVSLDEVVLIVRAEAGINFDSAMPGFHLYGTDIARCAIRAGRGVYALDAPVIHNSVPIALLDRGYRQAYRFLARKWRCQLPLRTCVVPVTHTELPVLRFNLRQLFKGRWRRVANNTVVAATMAFELGFDAYRGLPDAHV